MAFSFTKDNEIVAGGTRITYGTYTSAGGTAGGDIYTGLQKVYGMKLQQKGTAVVASHPVLNETLPMNDPVTVVTVANGAGYWMAWGA